mgnify:CR=1 FL=1
MGSYGSYEGDIVRDLGGGDLRSWAFAKVQCEDEGVKKVRINNNTVVITMKTPDVRERLIKQAERIGLPVIGSESSDDSEVSIPFRHVDMNGVINYVKVKELIVQ